jgi:sulfur carrier protein
MAEGASAIRIYVNGEVRALAEGTSLPGLIEALGMPLSAALVEHNGRALLRSEWPGTPLADGDRLEVLRVVAGG